MHISATPLRRSGQFLVWVILLAFALRMLVMFAASTYRVVQDDTDHFEFGWEMGRVARSLVEGQGFSSPLPSPTGPTAIVGPVYPLLLAGIFKVFGVYSTASSVAARILQSVVSSVTCLFLYFCGRDTAGERAGKLAALAWAVFPLNVFFSVARVWETTFTALLVAALFWFMLSSRDSLSYLRWAAVGALLGIAALISTSLVVLVVPFGISALVRSRMRVLLPAMVGAFTCLVVVSPWIIRNHSQFGKFMLRSNFPLEFRVGNNELSYGQKIESFHPSNTPSLNQHWTEVGESRFMEEDRASNAKFLSEHFGEFSFSTVNRIVNYWTGAWLKPITGFPNEWPMICATSTLSLFGFLGLWQMFSKGNCAASMYAGCLFIYPVVYYITTSQPRFYHAMTPLVILLGSYWILNCWDKFTSQWRERAQFEVSSKTEQMKVSNASRYELEAPGHESPISALMAEIPAFD
jgi:4-amino-4-deoxy-L-arabinose transferase-like glycosyltransferase